MPLENLFPCFLTFLARIARAIPTHLFILVCLLFITYLQKYRLPGAKTLLNCFYRRMLTTALTWRSSCIVVKYIRKTSKICCLSFIYSDVIKYTQNIASVHIVFNGERITNYVTCVSGCFGDVKAEDVSLSTPSFIIFLPFYKLNEDSGG